MLSTTEVIKTSKSYWFFQEYNADQVVPLIDFLKDVGSLTVAQLQSIISQVAEVFSVLTTQGKFVHGNLDSQSVYVEATEGSGLNVRVDVSDYSQLTRLLKVVNTENETNSFEEFRL